MLLVNKAVSWRGICVPLTFAFTPAFHLAQPLLDWAQAVGAPFFT
jgi:hypothetical protein